MAELAKQILDAENDVRKAKFLLDQVNASAKRSGQTTPAQAKAQAAYDKAAKRLKIIREQQASKKSGVGSVSIPGVGQDTKSAKGSGMPSSFMNPTSNNISVDAGTSKILQEFKNENPNAVLDMNFFSTGQGAGLLVYTGKATGKESSPTGGSYNKIVDGTRMVTNEINRFNADPKLKNRVLSLIRKYDPRADEIDAWNTWKQAVSDAAGLYAGGTGLKITPEDLLNRQLAKSKKDAPYTGPETTLARKVYDEATVKSWMEEGLLKYLEKPALEPGDMADLQASILAMTNKYNKTVVTDNRKGKRTVTETPAFSQAQIESTIKKFAQEKDPVAYERTKSMAFFDWAMGLGN